MKKDWGPIIDKLSQPVAFYREGASEPELWACGNCGMIRDREQEARHCYYCAPRVCQQPKCDERTEDRARTHCAHHEAMRNRLREIETFHKAENKLRFEDYKHDFFVTPDGEFCYGLEDLYDRDISDYPRYVYGVTPRRFQIDYDRLMEQVAEQADFVEDSSHLFPTNGEDELKAAVKAFNEAQPEAAWYEEDSNTVVVLDWPDPKDFGHEPDEVHSDWPERWDAEKVLKGEEPCVP